jgi:hypothetical protein
MVAFWLLRDYSAIALGDRMTIYSGNLSRFFKAFLAAVSLILSLNLGYGLAQVANLSSAHSTSLTPTESTSNLYSAKATVDSQENSPSSPVAIPESAGALTIPTVQRGPLSVPTGSSFLSSSAPFVLSPARQVAPFPIVLNQAVQRYVDDYIRNIGNFRARFFGMSPFFRDMVHTLLKYGVPADFICLAFAESAFGGYSKGPWQLTKTTARNFGLRVNGWVDERLDPLRSTRAAAEYLASLHDLLGDWRLTVVAWNTGENSALPFESLKHADYGKLVKSLPPRTRALLDRFMAADFIARNPTILGVNLTALTNDSIPSAHRSITVPPATSLKQAAEQAHTTVGIIRALNPALLRDRVPPDESYSLRVPIAAISAKSAQGAL